MKSHFALVLVTLTACSSTGVVPMDKDTYLVSKRSAQIGLGPADGPKADIYVEANAHCAKQDKAVETIALDMANSGLGQPANASLQFRCVKR